ncbi:MAG TPA: type II secretion system secretin GspD [Thermodesulfovibrionales bacterium]|nr:type II secretion system secretin GspD [Thermodesulfovibrionales bacterium]
MRALRKISAGFCLILVLIFSGYYISSNTVSTSIAETDSVEQKSEGQSPDKEMRRERVRPEKVRVKDKKVAFNFVDVEIPVVVKFISEVTGKNFVFDEKVKGTITIIAPSKLSVDDAFSLFTSVLELKGFTIIPSGKVYKIVPVAQAKQSGTELLRDEKGTVNDTYVTRLIQLKHISSSKALSFLQPLISRDGHISSFGPGNMMLIVDSSANIEKAMKILDSIDRPDMEEPELVPLKYASAEEVVKILNESLAQGAKTQPYAGRPLRGGEATSAASVEETKASVFADTRLNAVVLIADKQEKESMKRMIGLLDVPMPEATSKINVYFLEYADATELSKVLEGMISGISSQSKTGQAVQPGQPARSPFETGGRVIIAPDKATNSIIIVASPADYQSMLQVIKQLDRKRRQVYVEAMIVEASIDKLQELGAQWRITAKKDNEPVFIGGFGKIDSSAMQNIVSGLTGLTAGGLGNFLNVPIQTVGADGSVTNANLTIPGYAALFSLNEFKGSVNVLSTPQILTSDNKEAEIVVGQNVPFIAQRERDVTTANTYLNSIERKDVGITLRLTPQITEGEYVKLDIYQEISALTNASENILINIGPTTTKRSTKTSVVVRDNQTVVIGGLMEERETTNINKVPLLGDIPVIGWIFKNRSQEKTKTNLLVFLTPHIVKESEQLVKLSNEKRTEFARNEDRYVKGELLVRFKEGTEDGRISEIVAAEGASVISAPKGRGPYLLKLKEGEDVKSAVTIFSAYKEVDFAEPNYIIKMQHAK